ncbi:MAG: DUF4097 family beta strand repeat-containing protein, partial [Bdellovibrionales bacterium]|nr:DUF4097 family beta strand repeat-containing protein [Bdellovibrionales bacterium]
MSAATRNLQWFLLGFVSALGCLVLVVCAIFYFFSPLVKFDESTGTVSLLGGAMDIEAKTMITELSKDSSFVFGAIEGVSETSEATETLQIKFSSGEIHVDYNRTTELNWDCDGAGKGAQIIGDENKKTLTLDLRGAFVDCDISVPHKALEIYGQSGKIDVENIETELDVSLASGEVNLGLLQSLKYKMELNVGDGDVNSEIEAFKSGDGIPLSVDM